MSSNNTQAVAQSFNVTQPFKYIDQKTLKFIDNLSILDLIHFVNKNKQPEIIDMVYYYSNYLETYYHSHRTNLPTFLTLIVIVNCIPVALTLCNLTEYQLAAFLTFTSIFYICSCFLDFAMPRTMTKNLIFTADEKADNDDDDE